MLESEGVGTHVPSCSALFRLSTEEGGIFSAPYRTKLRSRAISSKDPDAELGIISTNLVNSHH